MGNPNYEFLIYCVLELFSIFLKAFEEEISINEFNTKMKMGLKRKIWPLVTVFTLRWIDL